MIVDLGLTSVAEDLEWLRDVWATSPDQLKDDDVRRGAATLRRLLLERGQGAIQFAWRKLGFQGQPKVIGPDMMMLFEQLGKPLEHAVTVIAGGAPVNGVSVVCLGIHRVAHPKTGVPPDAESGFAVETSSIAALVDERGHPPTEFDPAIRKEWRLGDYIESPGAIRKGAPVSRRDVIQFFSKEAGGVHVDALFPNARQRSDTERLAGELYDKVSADWRRRRAVCLLREGYNGRLTALHLNEEVLDLLHRHDARGALIRIAPVASAPA